MTQSNIQIIKRFIKEDEYVRKHIDPFLLKIDEMHIKLFDSYKNIQPLLNIIICNALYHVSDYSVRCGIRRRWRTFLIKKGLLKSIGAKRKKLNQ